MSATSVEASGDGYFEQLAGDGFPVGSSAEGTIDGHAVIEGVDPLLGSSTEGSADQCKTGVDDTAMGSPAEGHITGRSAVLLTGIGGWTNTVASGLKSDSGGSLPSSRKAGLSLSMLTLRWAFPIETVKYFSVLWTTGNGLSYGGCKLFFTASTQMKT